MTHKYLIRLETLTDAARFVSITTSLKGKIVVTDGEGLCANARSLMGVIYALEFDNIWCESEEDISFAIRDFID